MSKCYESFLSQYSLLCLGRLGWRSLRAPVFTISCRALDVCDVGAVHLVVANSFVLVLSLLLVFLVNILLFARQTMASHSACVVFRLFVDLLHVLSRCQHVVVGQTAAVLLPTNALLAFAFALLADVVASVESGVQLDRRRLRAVNNVRKLQRPNLPRLSRFQRRFLSFE